MTDHCRQFVFIDAHGTSIPNLGHAARTLGADTEHAWLHVSTRSGDDLFDSKQITACADLIRQADAVVMILHGGTDSIPGFHSLAEAARGKLLHIQTTSAAPDLLELTDHYGADFTSASALERSAYLSRGGHINLRNLLCHMGQELAQTNAPAAAPPQTLPTEGIYHPDWDGDIHKKDAYLAWQQQRLTNAAERPVIGIWFHQYYWVNGDLGFMNALIQQLEDQGALPVPVFHIRRQDADLGNMPLDQLIDTFFCHDSKPVIDVLLSPMTFSVTLQNPAMKSVLTDLDVPVLHVMVTNSPSTLWHETEQAVSPTDVSVNAAQPEFDGCVIGTVVACRDDAGRDPLTGGRCVQRIPIPEQMERASRWAINWAHLRRTVASDKKVAILFHQYPPRSDTLGTAIGLDAFESVRLLLQHLKQAGYAVERDYDNGDALAFELLDRLTNDRRYLPMGMLAKRAIGRVSGQTARNLHDKRTPRMQDEMDARWGEVPGVTFNHNGDLLVGGVINGNIFIGMQPPRAKMEDGHVPELQPDGTTTHDPYLPATHHYLAYYHWLRHEFGAQAVYHIGTHGTLEWMPGKSLGLSNNCYPDAVLGELPNFYPYIINNPGEGIQAKRRSYAAMLGHMIPPQTTAEISGDLARLDELLHKAFLAEQQDPAKMPIILDEVWELVSASHLDVDLELNQDRLRQAPRDELQKIHAYLTRISVTTIDDGLHIFGTPPQGRHFSETVVQMTRLPHRQAPSLWDAIATAYGWDCDALRDRPEEISPDGKRTYGQCLVELIKDAETAIQNLQSLDWTEDAIAAVTNEQFHGSPAVQNALQHVAENVRPRLLSITDELDYAVHGGNGGHIPPGGAGCPTRGNLNVLPTGRNFYSVDPYAVPTPEAWQIGVAQGDALIERYIADTGRIPQNIGIILWGSSTMRTGGNDVAEVLYLMGMRPIWAKGSERVTGVEVIPLSELKHPRIDVTVRTAGLTRDAFPNVLELLDEATCMAAALDEPEDMNFLAHHVAVDREAFLKAGHSLEDAQRRATYRVYCAKPGCYGAGVANLLDSKDWQTVEDLGNLFINWGGYAYGKGVYGEDRRDDFRQRLGKLDLTIKNEDSRERNMFSCDDYNSFHGGMNAAIKTVSGNYVPSYTGDVSDPRKPIIRTSEEETRFLFRSRILNPKWIEGLKRHGYKGAGDMSRTVDFCFQWDATSNILDDWQYKAIAETYVLSKDMQEHFKKHNPYALHNITETLLEAISRGMWEHPDNYANELQTLFLESEGMVEDSLM